MWLPWLLWQDDVRLEKDGLFADEAGEERNPGGANTNTTAKNFTAVGKP
jgi:hypothetical protein